MRIALLVMFSLAGCVRSYQRNAVIVTATDNLVRKRNPAAEVAELVEPPTKRYRVIARIATWNDAVDEARSFRCTPPDCDSWESARVIAAGLGANAVLLHERKLIPCKKSAQFVSVADATGAAAVATGEQEKICVSLEFEAVIVDGGKLSCEAEQSCRTARKDRYDMAPERGALAPPSSEKL